ncbi:MAG TPA: arginine--tRNA ligase [Flavobacterium sp.]|nr:arginine--tRNA ligase [Flavobacterium sp. UBA2787]HRE79175.1 arginine--tRNA ligase [Flavobacterium sp.]
MNVAKILNEPIKQAVLNLFEVTVEKIEFQATRRDFEGDITVVIFPLVKMIKGNPIEIGNKIGTYLVENVAVVEKFNVVSGFLNIVISDDYFINFFSSIKNDASFGFVLQNNSEKAVLVEYSSPNTNKPLHLGHVRNNLLGFSVAEIIKASGKKVYKTQIINDRGIHICKSMLAWQKFGNGQTPETSGLKGDHLVGKYYVRFDKEYKDQYSKLRDKHIEQVEKNIKELETTGVWGRLDSTLLEILDNSLRNFIKENVAVEISNDFLLKNIFFTSDFVLSTTKEEGIKDLRKSFISAVYKYVNGLEYENDIVLKKAIQSYKKEEEKHIPIMLEAQQMLLDWEAGKPEVIELWKTMNNWVYDGFNETYKNLGVDFDSYYYESNTYLLGKEVVQFGLEKGIFEKDPDGSVWIDLTEDGLDRKIVLRSDGTAVYMTQDIGTAIQRVKDFPDVGGMVYTVGNEQDYHFKVLFLILKKLGFDWAENLYHLSYGMVELPSGKMKSREGTVVDADDLMVEMTETAAKISQELGKLDGYSEEEKQRLYKIIGLGALKYFMLKVDPKKSMLFNPEESVDFAGNTGPFIQYTYARIQSILRKANFDFSAEVNEISLHPKEKELIKVLELYPELIQNAAQFYSPALVANYTYELVKEYNSFYQAVPILPETNENLKKFRVQLSKKVGETIKSAFSLLGIEVPERM